MEQIRADAFAQFQALAQCSDSVHSTKILESQQGQPADYVTYPKETILDEAKSRITAGKSILIHISKTQIPHFHIKRQLFLELLSVLEIDPAVLQHLASFDFAFIPIYGAKNTSFYFRAGYGALVWTFDSASNTSRGFMFREATDETQIGMFNIGSYVAANVSLLEQPDGLVWLSFMHAFACNRGLLRGAGVTFINIERNTGYGPWGRPEGEVNADLLTGWSKDVAGAAVSVATAERNFGVMSGIHEHLQRKDDSGASAFHDQAALAMCKSHINNEIQNARFFMERQRVQQAVLFNLITRADTKASVELTKASKELTEANLEIAKAAKNDSGAMKTISVMTMLFLPATFFAALFSMPTLRWDQPTVTSNRFWIYWVFTIPTTIFVFAVWALRVYLPSIRKYREMSRSLGRIGDRIQDQKAPVP